MFLIDQKLLPQYLLYNFKFETSIRILLFDILNFNMDLSTINKKTNYLIAYFFK